MPGGEAKRCWTVRPASGLEAFTPERLKLGLGATESFVDDFFRLRRRFEIGVFDPVSIGRG